MKMLKRMRAAERRTINSRREKASFIVENTSNSRSSAVSGDGKYSHTGYTPDGAGRVGALSISNSENVRKRKCFEVPRTNTARSLGGR
jgi:hypothetical protein